MCAPYLILIVLDTEENGLRLSLILMTLILTRIHCAESGEESTETETVYSLKCHISQEVNHLHEGLKRVSLVLSFFVCSNF